MKLPKREWVPLPQCVELVVKTTNCQTDQAREALIGGLRDGRIRSRAFDNFGAEHNEIRHEDWYEPIDWESNKLYAHESSGWHGYDITFESIEINRSDILKWLTDHSASPGRDSRQGRRGSRPPKYDWDGVYVEIIRVAVQQGLPRTQAELVRHIQNWFSEVANEEPTESEIKKRISRIYHALGLADN